MSSLSRAIGGYFELELPQGRLEKYPDALKYQSARAAFSALLCVGAPKKVWMPKYICNSMLAPLRKTGIELAWYDLTDELEVPDNVYIGKSEWLLYVNYFGICGDKVDVLLQRFPPEQIILDYSQAFFSAPHRRALATIYSPRKFLGVPDGGLLYSQISVPPPDKVDSGSFSRMEHLIKRLGDSPEAGYSDYQHAEESLDELLPRRMSRLTEEILASVDLRSVCLRRRENYQFLYAEIGRRGQEINNTDTPMCFPYYSGNSELRQRLIDNRIFVPTYWPDAIERLPAETGDILVRNMLPLPIDQRYGITDMERILSVILDSE